MLKVSHLAPSGFGISTFILTRNIKKQSICRKTRLKCKFYGAYLGLKSLTAGGPGPALGPWKLSGERGGGVDALSCYLGLICKHFDTKWDTKNIVDQNLERARACCAPL